MLAEVAVATAPEVFEERDRWTLLGLARFLLAAVVVVFHLQRRLAPAQVSWITQLDGRVAVVAFLLVSGYSIAASLAKSRVGFYRRRLLRIYPLLIGAVVLTQALCTLAPERYPVRGWNVALGNIVFPPGHVYAVPTLNLPLWSLGVEIVFYLAAPFLFTAPRALRWLLIAVSMGAFVSPLVQEWMYGAPSLCYLWPWLLGFELHRDRSPWLVLVTALAVALLRFHPIVSYGAYSGLMYLATLALIAAPRLPVMRGAAARAVDYLGAISFPLYLVHFPVLITLADVGQMQNRPLMLSLVMAVTVVFHHAVDGPGKRCLEKLV